MKHRLLFAAATAAALLVANPASAVITITSDPVLFWNQLAIQNLVGGIAAAPLLGGAPGQTRGYAMVNIAMHDAVNAVTGGANTSYLSGVTSFGGSAQAAAAQAAYNVIVGLRGGTSNAQLDDALAASLAAVTDATARTNGANSGAAYASAVLGTTVPGSRGADGSTNPGGITYTPTGAPGNFVPTPTAAVPFWGSVTPFTMTSGDQFRAGPPPALDSAAYAAAYNEVKAIGSVGSVARTADQTAAALFWDAAAGSPWMQIGLAVAENEGFSTLRNAQAFALLSTGLADAIIAGFDTKYHYDFWRPQSAIRGGNTDGNSDTDGDGDWTSLFAAPSHPSYISTHSALSGAGSTILASIFNDDTGFTFTIAGDTRTFNGLPGITPLQQAALDGANSRLWGGIHFSFDNAAGLRMGQQVGQQALAQRNIQAVPEPATWAMMIIGFGLMGAALRTRRIGVRFAGA